MLAAADLKPGERKVISEGAEGPVVEVIRRSTSDVVVPVAAPDEAVDVAEDTTIGDE
jgi:small subunit ribosomal protein S2